MVVPCLRPTAVLAAPSVPSLSLAAVERSLLPLAVVERSLLPLAVVDYALLATPILAVGLVILLVVRSVVLVGEDQVHVVTDDGDAVDVIEEGIRVTSPLRSGGRTVPTTPVRFQYDGGVVETEDGVAVRGAASGSFRVVDPERLVSITRQYPGDVKRRIDEAYVTQVERLSWGEEADPGATLEQRVRSEVERALDRWGVELEELTVDRLERAE